MKKLVFISLSLLLLILIPGCITFQTSPPVIAPPIGQPSVIETFSSNPTAINSGGTSTLLWNVTGANSVSIDQGIGQVDAAGIRIVSPDTSTMYTISATNAAGTVSRTAMTTVNSITPAPPIISGVRSITLSPMSNDESGSVVKAISQGTGQAVYTTTMNNACIGDDSSNSESRAFLSFDISAIPQTAVIKEAILDLSNFTKTGNPTYETMYGGFGALKVYHHQYGKLSDTNTITSMVWWNHSAKLTQNGSIINYPISPWAWDVKNDEDGNSVIQTLVQAGQTRSQFSIQFYSSTDWENEADKLCFSNVTLTIKYTMP